MTKVHGSSSLGKSSWWHFQAEPRQIKWIHNQGRMLSTAWELHHIQSFWYGFFCLDNIRAQRLGPTFVSFLFLHPGNHSRHFERTSCNHFHSSLSHSCGCGPFYLLSSLFSRSSFPLALPQDWRNNIRSLSLLPLLQFKNLRRVPCRETTWMRRSNIVSLSK